MIYSQHIYYSHVFSSLSLFSFFFLLFIHVFFSITLSFHFINFTLIYLYSQALFQFLLACPFVRLARETMKLKSLSLRVSFIEYYRVKCYLRIGREQTGIVSKAREFNGKIVGKSKEKEQGN